MNLIFQKFLSTFFAFFLEFIKKRIITRMEKLNLIMGKERIPKTSKEETQVDNFYSLIKGFQILGYDYFNPE